MLGCVKHPDFKSSYSQFRVRIRRGSQLLASTGIKHVLIMPKFYNGAEELSIIIRDEMNIKILAFCILMNK